MNDPMRILKSDHREVEQLLKKLADSDEGAGRKKLADELAKKLTAHMDIEESIVYPPVSEEVGEEDREEAEIEHRLARQGLETVLSMVEQPGFGAAVQMLMGGISHHVEEEESELLPELKDALDRETWLEMGDAIVAAKRAAGLPVPQNTRRRSTKRRGRTAGATRANESKTRSSNTSQGNTSTDNTGRASKPAKPAKKAAAARTTTSAKR